MRGGGRFVLARARAARAPLLTLLVVAAVAATLLVGMAVALRAVEAHDVRAALSDASSSRAQALISVADGSDAPLADAVRRTLATHGDPAVTVDEAGGVVTVIADAARITGDDVARLADALRALPAEARDAVGSRVQVAGGLAATLAGIDDGIQARRGPTTVAIGFLALLTAVVVGAVALEPVRARAGESLLLRARGARARTLGALAGVETAAVSLAGALLGAGVAVGVAALLALPSPGLVFAAVAAGGVALAATLVAVIVTVRGADRRPGRAQLAAAAAVAVVLAVLTALAAWQFAQAGTPVIRGGDGGTSIDPLVAIAPSLILALAAVVAVLVATPTARVIAAALAPTRRVRPVTPLRLAARRPARHALPIAVVAFTVGIATVAAAYQGTTRALGDAPEALRVGADVRVTTIPDTLPPDEVATAARDAGAEVTAVARGFTALGPGARIPVVAIDGSGVGEVMLDAGGTIDPRAIGDAVALRGAGIPVPGDVLELTVTAPEPPPVELDGESYQPGALLANIRLTFGSDEGRIWTYSFVNGAPPTESSDGVSFDPAQVDPERRERISLPDGAWSLLSIGVSSASWAGEGYVELSDLESDGIALDLSQMTAAPGTPGALETGDVVRVTPQVGTTEALLTTVIGPGVPRAAPVVLTAALAADLSLTEGDSIALEFDRPDFEADVVVAAIVPILPGTPSGQGLLADIGTLGLLSGETIVPNQLWMSTADADAVAAGLSESFDGTTVLIADPRQGDAAAATAWGFVLAAGGALVLALAVLALRRTRTRADARELALLAVLGLGRRGAVRVRTAEDLFALAIGVIGGIAAGLATAVLIVPPLVRAAYGTVPEAYPVPLVWPWVALAVVVVGVAAACAAVISSIRVPRALAPALRESE